VIHVLRTYVAAPGKRDALLERFRRTTLPLFASHGIVITGFWESHDDADTLAYLCTFETHADRERAWAAFNSDPNWLAAKADSERDGPLVASMTTLNLDSIATA
jgi:hypothetical protein